MYCFAFYFQFEDFLMNIIILVSFRVPYNHQYQPYFISEYSGQSANVSRVLDTLLHGYDKRLRPKYKGKMAYRWLRLVLLSPSLDHIIYTSQFVPVRQQGHIGAGTLAKAQAWKPGHDSVTWKQFILWFYFGTYGCFVCKIPVLVSYLKTVIK